LRDKISNILPEIYKVENITTKKVWNHFIKLEEYRHDIIHQKSIERTEFYKRYFKTNIFKICQSAEDIISIFYKKHAKKDRTNPLWPWLINQKKEFPIRYDYDPNDFEVVGNVWEGIKK
jgi:hypothetical protein